jgi:replicative DNA helicase
MTTFPAPLTLEAARAEAQPWPVPRPLTRPAPPVLNLAVAIPDHLAELREFCEAVAASLQVPTDSVPPLVVALASIGTARALEIEPAPGWRETAPTWFAVLAEPGERKSALLSLLARPVYDWQADERAYLRHELAAYGERRRIAEARLAGKRDQAKRAKTGEESAKLERDALDLAASLENLPPLAAPELITSDCTPEAARDLLARNGEKLAIVSAEIDAGQLMGSRHAKSGAPNIDLFLKGYTGDPAPAHRVGKDVPLARPALAFVLCVQPEALREVLGDRTAKDRGLVPRLCLVAPESRMGTRLDLNPGEVPPHLRAWWGASVRRLLDLKWPGRVILTATGPARHEGAPRVLTLDDEARAVFDVLRRDLETRNGPDGDLRPLAAFTSKLPGTVARIALALEALGNPAAERITGETMRAACEWAPWLIAHARHVLGDAAEPDEVKNARRLLRLIRQHRLAELSAREAQRLADTLTSDEVKAALEVLQDGEWLRPLPPPPAKPQGGKTPSPRFAVHPAALEA